MQRALHMLYRGAAAAAPSAAIARACMPGVRVGMRAPSASLARAHAHAHTHRHASTLTWDAAQTTIKSNKVVLFVKSYCPVCNDLADRFDDAEVAIKRVVLDFYDNGNEIRDKLKEQTKQPHVPYVFIAGAHTPSETVISGMKSPGALKPTLEQAGIEVKGYFRS